MDGSVPAPLDEPVEDVPVPQNTGSVFRNDTEEDRAGEGDSEADGLFLSSDGASLGVVKRSNGES